MEVPTVQFPTVQLKVITISTPLSPTTLLVPLSLVHRGAVAGLALEAADGRPAQRLPLLRVLLLLRLCDLLGRNSGVVGENKGEVMGSVVSTGRTLRWAYCAGSAMASAANWRLFSALLLCTRRCTSLYAPMNAAEPTACSSLSSSSAASSLANCTGDCTASGVVFTASVARTATSTICDR